MRYPAFDTILAVLLFAAAVIAVFGVYNARHELAWVLGI